MLAVFASVGFASADDSGTCGDNLTWSYNSATHALTISGTGEMTNYSYVQDVPWYPWGIDEITSVSLPDGLTSIGDRAFKDCIGLTSVTIPSNVTKIGNHAFNFCTGLTSVTIPESVTSIGNYAFYSCTGLTSVTMLSLTPPTLGNSSALPSTCKIYVPCGTLERYNAAGYSNCEYPDSECGDDSGICGDNLTWSYNSATHVLTITGSGAMNDYASIDFVPWFSYIFDITSVSLPEGLTSIGNYAFYFCPGLTSVNIPNSVTSIGQQAFKGCSSLTSVTIPNSVTSIGFDAFHNCTSLTSVTMLSLTPPTLGKSALPSTCKIYVPCGTLERYNAAGYSNCEYPDSECGDDSGICGDNLTWSYNSATHVLTITGSGAMNDYVCELYSNCAPWNSYVSEITSISLPEGLTSIGDYAFDGCASLTSVTIPNSVTSIGECAFFYCTSLTSVIIGNSLTWMGRAAFDGCGSLTSVTILSQAPPTLNHSSALPYGCRVYVPADYLSAYENDEDWEQYYDVQPIEAESIYAQDWQVIPHYNSVDIIWPNVVDAETYEIVVTSDGVALCTLIFNAQGQLSNIVFHAPAAERHNAAASQQGFRFTVTGLEDGSAYSLTVNAKDANGNVIKTFSQDFTTGATALESVNADGASLKPRKVIENGRFVILMPDGRKFDAAGRRLDR